MSPLLNQAAAREDLSRGETHDAVHGSFINLMKLLNVEKLIFLVLASNHFMFRCRSCDERMSFMMDNDYKTLNIVYINIHMSLRINMLHI